MFWTLVRDSQLWFTFVGLLIQNPLITSQEPLGTFSWEYTWKLLSYKYVVLIYSLNCFTAANSHLEQRKDPVDPDSISHILSSQLCDQSVTTTVSILVVFDSLVVGVDCCLCYIFFPVWCFFFNCMLMRIHRKIIKYPQHHKWEKISTIRLPTLPLCVAGRGKGKRKWWAEVTKMFSGMRGKTLGSWLCSNVLK